MSEITDVKIAEGQDRKKVSAYTTKVSFTRLEPKEETLSLLDIENQMASVENNKANALANYNAQIARFDAELEKLVAIKEQIEQVVNAK